ncbi:metal ABC transporter ATP-binding protein [Desulfogranum mediterraneum]|uniref:metal ABC transporter ATP-binding protein n=1 Tax=Desulfogranum mediterraneum TaxID=160661 RepID=UPI00041866F0|nr:ABC transporter ATP-binding protein [Desulfogranum mediterraneum]
MTDQPAQAAIEIHDLCFSYDQLPVLTEVNLTVHAQDTLCIVGPNGGGKTTLVKLIIGSLTPDSGRVSIFGQAPQDAHHRFGYVPQHAIYDPHFPISVREVVCMGRLGHPGGNRRYSRSDKAKAMAALKEVDLVQMASRPFSALSGGQRQRVLIARALASEGTILILDEPTANIDHESEEHFYDLLQRLKHRMTILMVTHEVGFASTFFHRIACVNNQVIIHPTSELTGELIQNMYGGDLQMIRHDHVCSEEGHTIV